MTTTDYFTKRWTAFVAWPGTPRGSYDEEIDVDAPNEAQARRKAQALLDDPEQYEPGGRVKRVVRFYPEVTIWSW